MQPINIYYLITILSEMSFQGTHATCNGLWNNLLMCKTPSGYQYQHLKCQVIACGVSYREEIWEDMHEHVNKSDLNYEGIIIILEQRKAGHSYSMWHR